MVGTPNLLFNWEGCDKHMVTIHTSTMGRRSFRRCTRSPSGHQGKGGGAEGWRFFLLTIFMVVKGIFYWPVMSSSLEECL